MTITNQTLMWLAPLAGAAAMTATTLITNWLDTRKASKETSAPTGPVPGGATYILAREAALAAIEAAISASPNGRVSGSGTEPKVRVPDASHRP